MKAPQGPQSMDNAAWVKFREEFPFSAKFRDVIDKKFADKSDFKLAKAFFEQLGAAFVMNKNSVYFTEEKFAVFFKLGMWR